MSENKCPKCGASISENKQYCSHCGARLSLVIEAPKIIEKKAKPKKELSPKTKKRLKIAGIAVAASAVVGTTIGLLVPFVFVPLAQISEVKRGDIFSFNKTGDSYSVEVKPSLKQYFDDYLSSEITIPSEYKGLPVTEIESSGFSYCSSLTSITIPNSVASIGERAFSGCSSLTSITIPFVGGSATSNGDFGYLFGGSSDVPSALKEVVIGDGCTSIGDHAFYECSSLTSITIPNSVTSIGYGAFCGCSSLESIIIPTSVTSISNFAFDGCLNLYKVLYAGSAAEWSSISVGDGNYYLKDRYYYSEEEPTGSGNYWHYVDGVPTIW